MIDYLIIGAGIAGISFAETCLQNNKSILVYDNNSQNSSKIAGGLYNPVILKRFSGLWNAQNQINLLNDFYTIVEDKLQVKLDHKLPILRKFFSVEEQNNWFAASDKAELAPFLSLDLIVKSFKGIDAPLGYGQVLQSGYVNTAYLLEVYQKYLSDLGLMMADTFDYSKLMLTDDKIVYQNIEAKNIVFAEGFGIHANPFFNYLPLDGTKGELFVIKAPELSLDTIINTSVFIVPLGNDLFKVGATYNWNDKTDIPTEEGKRELIERIKEILNCPFEIVSHQAGVRPTVKDRKPLLGVHPIYKNAFILNGLGTRGVMLGPSMAKDLFDFIENDKPLENAINISRFKKAYQDFYRNS